MNRSSVVLLCVLSLHVTASASAQAEDLVPAAGARPAVGAGDQAGADVRSVVGSAHDDRGADPHASERAAAWLVIAARLGLDPGHDSPESLDTETRAELARHARVVARIDRITQLSAELSRPELGARASALLVIENAQHEQRLRAAGARRPG